jgi:hypothetical protein
VEVTAVYVCEQRPQPVANGTFSQYTSRSRSFTAGGSGVTHAPGGDLLSLLAQEGSSSLLEFREVPGEVVRQIRFSRKTRPTVALNPDGAVKGQTMRAVRELSPSSAAILKSLVLEKAETNIRSSRDRLPVDDLNKATPQHIWWAVQELVAGHVQHSFGESTDYDLITDEDHRLTPKAVFGVALTRVLGWEVLPKHFTAGVGSPCFRLLALAGYDIVPKGELPHTTNSRLWTIQKSRCGTRPGGNWCRT